MSFILDGKLCYAVIFGYFVTHVVLCGTVATVHKSAQICIVNRLSHVCIIIIVLLPRIDNSLIAHDLCTSLQWKNSETLRKGSLNSIV